MFTVIFVEQEHMELVREYNLFLQPFMDTDQFAFCRWCPEDGERPEDVIPELSDIVGVRNDWRAIILSGTERLRNHASGNPEEQSKSDTDHRNPFNFVHYEEPVREIKVIEVPDDEEFTHNHQDADPADGEEARKPKMVKYVEKEDILTYSERRIAAREKAFKEAAKNPLVRLVSYLCEDPEVVEDETIKGEIPIPTVSSDTDRMIPEFELESYKARQEARWAAHRKREIHRELRGREVMPWAMPREVICIALRSGKRLNDELDTAWDIHEEHHYSKFYDWNLYFDKMRYIVYDIGDIEENSYLTDFVTFYTAVMLFAGQETPLGVFSPFRVYQMSCTMDPARLSRYLRAYLDRLDSTRTDIKMLINTLQEEALEHLKDKDARRIFCSNVSVPVSVSNEIDYSEMIYRKRPKLFTDMPGSEAGDFEGKEHENLGILRHLLKQPRRSVKRAASELRTMNVINDDKTASLNEFQLEDVKEHTLDEEKSSVSVQIKELYDSEVYEKMLKNAADDVNTVLARRITMRQGLGFSASVIVSIIIFSLPLFIGNRQSSETILNSVLLIGFALLAVLICSFISLLILRHDLVKVIREFNRVMNDIKDSIDASLDSYGRYLSHICNAMRGNSVLQYSDNVYGIKSVKLSVYNKHLADINEREALVNSLFGTVLVNAVPGEGKPYNYDFERPIDYQYPMYDGPHFERELDFLQPGNLVTIPVDFITNISVRREELYD